MQKPQSKQLQARSVKREYLCLVHGDVRGKGRIDQPIGRHPKVRVKMAVLASGKPAVTHFQVRQCFANVCFVKVQLETGRTHQIRVHLAHESHPLVGCAVLSAGCLPVVISSGCGGKVGVAHAGWRGLAKGVVPELIQNMGIDPSKARAWLGVCIGRNSFEIGEEVRDAFQASPAFFGLSIQTAFAKITEGIGSTKLTADLKLLASIQLKGLGVKSITSTTECFVG